MNKNLIIAYGIWVATVITILIVVLSGNAGLLQTNLSFLFSLLNINLPILSTTVGMTLILPVLSLLGLVIFTFYYHVPSLYHFPFFLGGNREKRVIAQDVVKRVVLLTMIANASIYLAVIGFFSVVDVTTFAQNSLILLFAIVFGPVILIDVFYEFKAFLAQADALKTGE